jgi:hypothetical protein
LRGSERRLTTEKTPNIQSPMQILNWTLSVGRWTFDVDA